MNLGTLKNVRFHKNLSTLLLKPQVNWQTMRWWSLGKSIGRSFVDSQTLFTRTYVSTNPPCFLTRFSRFNSSFIHHDSNLGFTTSNAFKSWKDLKKQHIKYQKITKGDVIDLREFLFTENRDYLIRHDGTLVRADQLAGKVIVLYFMTLSHDLRISLEWNPYTYILKDMYNYLTHNNGVEIVFVAFDDESGEVYREHFENKFSRMPWTAVPFSDVVCRRNLAMKFNINRTTTLFVVDSTGTVLQSDAKSIIKDYGVLGLPFSDERKKELDAEEEAVVQQPSLMSLLGSPQRDYVITNKGEKVPIRSLEEKVVGLYFYVEDGFCNSKEDIIRIYEQLKKVEENFEIVLIYPEKAYTYYTSADEAEFWEAFRTMPWLALPFDDPNIKKLKRVFEFPSEQHDDTLDIRPVLVIFGPHGEFIEPLGDHIIMDGCPAYPFTREKVAQLELEKVQKLKMEMLWDRNTVFSRPDGSQMRFSQLDGKRVLHIFEENPYSTNDRLFLMKLKEKYLELRGTDGEFEVIHVLEEVEKGVLPMQDLPWLVSPASKLLPAANDFFCEDYGIYSHHLILLAFNQDGNVVRKTIYPVLEETDFPFYSGSMMEEALSQLISNFNWYYWLVYPKKGRIYTFHKKLRQPSCRNVGSGHGVWSINI